MKYLLSVSSITPGSGLSKYVLTLADLLSKNGNEVELLTTHTIDAVYELEQAAKYGISRCYQLGNLGKVSKRIRSISIIHSIRPDFLINNYNGLIQYILPFLRREIKVIHILHNDTDDFYRIASINGKYTNGWIAPTQAIADHFNVYTANKFAKRVKVIAHGVETSSTLLNSSEDYLQLIFVGMLFEHKGVKILPDIIARLHEDGVKFKFFIVGKGLLGDWLKSELKKEISEGCVSMSGVVPFADVYELQSKADIFIYPTQLDAFGLVIAEAMINGTVPVVSLLPGVTDNLIDDNLNGFLVPQDDVEAFVEKVKLLNEDRTLLKQMKEAARDKALKEFSCDTMARNYSEYFKSLL